jgi:hypothetical protein
MPYLMVSQIMPGGELPADLKLRKTVHQTIKKVTDDIDVFHFNTAIVL